MKPYKVSVALVNSPGRPCSLKALNDHNVLYKVSKIAVEPSLNLNSKLRSRHLYKHLLWLHALKISRSATSKSSSTNVSCFVLLNVIIFDAELPDVDVEALITT